jgi:acyl carrier protein
MNKRLEMVHDIVPIGFSPGHEVLLLDERIEEVGSDRIGEIAVRSRFLSPGYWRRPELTTSKFLPDPNGGDERIYLTGDLGRLDADGCLFHLGRKDNRIKIRGFTVEPFEVEQVLLRHPAVKEAAVVGCRSDSGEQHLVAYCVPALDAAPSTDELTRSMQATVPSYMVPSKFVMIDALPLTPNGKIDRLALPATDRFRPKLGNQYVAPKTFVEATLAAIWGTILSLEQIGVTDNFFDLGGHSLAASRVISRVIQTFQLELPLKALFDAPTMAEMAAIVEQNRANQANDAEIAQMLREVEAMSEEEAEKLLAGTTARRLQDDSHE